MSNAKYRMEHNQCNWIILGLTPRSHQDLHPVPTVKSLRQDVGPPLFTLLQPKMPTDGAKIGRCDHPLDLAWSHHIESHIIYHSTLLGLTQTTYFLNEVPRVTNRLVGHMWKWRWCTNELSFIKKSVFKLFIFTKHKQRYSRKCQNDIFLVFYQNVRWHPFENQYLFLSSVSTWP